MMTWSSEQDRTLLDTDVLLAIIAQADEVGLYEFDLRVESQQRPPEEGGDIFFIIGNVVFEEDQTGEAVRTDDERIATVYTSNPDSDDPTYDARAVAEYIIRSAGIMPGLASQLIEAGEREQKYRQTLSAVAYFFAQAYRELIDMSDDPSRIHRLIEPISRMLNVQLEWADILPVVDDE